MTTTSKIVEKTNIEMLNSFQSEVKTVICYEIGRTESTNPLSGVTTLTIYYRCVEILTGPGEWILNN